MARIQVVVLKKVDWIEHGGDWVRALDTQLRGMSPIRTMRARRGGRGHDLWARLEYEFEPSVTGGVSGFLVTTRQPKGVVLEIDVTDDFDDQSMDRWSALGEAMRRALPTDATPFTWEALLGIETELNAFLQPGRIGPLRALPGFRLARTDASLPFAPIRIVGTVSGGSWLYLKPKARRNARLAAAVLSVSWGLLVRMFHEVRSDEAGEFAGILEPLTPFDGIISAGEVPQVHRWEVPQWCNDAMWDAISTSSDLGNALLAYHEGLSLERDDHYSFAFPAYCAALEAVGAMFSEVPTECVSCGHIDGAGSRFMMAVRLVALPVDDVARIKKMYSKYRSGTVHGALLHGGEEGGRTLTQMGNPFIFDDDTRFYLGLALIRTHTRAVLKYLLESAASAGGEASQ